MSDPESSKSGGGLAEEFLARLRRGERPAMTEYQRRLPDLAEQIEDLFRPS